MKQDTIGNVCSFESNFFYKTPVGRITLHDIPLTGKACGIYKLCFNDYFYIGQSINILSRIRSHIRDINRHYNDKGFKTKTSQKILQYIDSHLDLEEVNVHLLEPCDMFKLASVEYKWIKQYVLDERCLNSVHDMRHSPSFYKNPILVGSQELKFDLATKEQIKLYKKFLKDLKFLKKNNL